MCEDYDVIVIGGGHAGTEAAWAAASVLARCAGRGVAASGGGVALITMDPARIGQMSCNPAIGGLAKGQIVREIDAMGGLMGLAADEAGIMFKVLNTSKGAAVRGPRCQADKYAYPASIQRLLSERTNIDVIAATVDEIIIERGRIVGVRLPAGAHVVKPDAAAIEWNLTNAGCAQPVYSSPRPSQGGGREGGRPDGRSVATHLLTPSLEGRGQSAHPSLEKRGDRAAQPTLIRARAVVLTTGTFMRGLLHTGEKKVVGGRMGEGAAVRISDNLRALGFELGRLKTGTPPRLDKSTIDWTALERQVGDARPQPFSDLSPEALPVGRFPHLPQIDCRISHTTPEAHEVIRANLHRAPMYSGQIEADSGPRYCPSIEDKVVRFPDRESHHVFLEPESLHSSEIYANGIPTSLPVDVQERLVHTMPGCAHARILKWGYAVEYDMVRPHQIDASCMTKLINGLFLAGQINGTSGYEEAAGQGLIAGLNAARFACGDDLIRLRRDQAYIGVMLDDLITKTPREPYRMFTSRAEYRLLLRADNADLRLTPLARELGLVDDRRWRVHQHRAREIDRLRRHFDITSVGGRSLRELARRPDGSIALLLPHLNGFSDLPLIDRVITEAKYEGYIARQQAEIRRQVSAERQRIPDWLDPHHVTGLRAEAAEALARFRPATMGQAGRLESISPADLTLIAVAIKRGTADRVGA